MKRFKRLLPILISTLILGKSVFGCVCIGPENPKEALKNWSDTVFSGEITAIDKLKVDNFEAAVMTFKVENVWKGVSTKEIAVRDYMSGSDCASADFKVGERYIIFASSFDSKGAVLKDDLNNPFVSVDVCSWTSNLAGNRAKVILKQIGKGKPVKLKSLK